MINKAFKNIASKKVRLNQIILLPFLTVLVQRQQQRWMSEAKLPSDRLMHDKHDSSKSQLVNNESDCTITCEIH